MLERLKSAIQDLLPDSTTAAGEDSDSLELAITALLIEMSRADAHLDRAEAELIRDIVARHFGGTGTSAAELFDRAHAASEASVSTYEFTRIMNETLDQSEKLWVIERLWEVAYADGEVEKYEEALVRKIADLLHVSHPALVSARLRVQKQSGHD